MGTYKQKTCKICKSKFTPVRQFQNWCSPECGLELAIQRREKAQERRKRKEAREQREKLKTRSDWLREAQNATNAYIRERDKQAPCISCGRFHEGQWHAGHYRSIGAASGLRFHPDNIHKQCAPCNNHKSGNAIEYRIRLCKKIGTDKVEWLEGENKPVNLSIEDIKEIKAYYKEQLKWLKTNGVSG